ncbi:MAG: hypothetical protein ACK5LX_06895 [Oscillospiraceae bacterium]
MSGKIYSDQHFKAERNATKDEDNMIRAKAVNEQLHSEELETERRDRKKAKQGFHKSTPLKDNKN